MECLEGHKNIKLFGHDTYGQDLCQECWYNHGWITKVERPNIGLSFNGRTAVSEIVNLGSNPNGPTRRIKMDPSPSQAGVIAFCVFTVIGFLAVLYFAAMFVHSLVVHT